MNYAESIVAKPSWILGTEESADEYTQNMAGLSLRQCVKKTKVNPLNSDNGY